MNEDRAPRLDIEPGMVVANRYRITRPLGRGGMGEVFAAENIRTGRHVALKLLRSDSKAKSSAIARFRQEARAAGSINSDHVTQVLDVEEDAELGICLVFELLEGESLIERLKRTGPIPFEELHGIIDQVWMGLADAHRVGIIHRDLKPSNVFLERRPDGTMRVKILDFGISKVPKEVGGETLTEMGQSLGTFSFMPPEQIGKAKTVDHRADIYACATLIFQSLSGQLPYHARNILVMVEMKSKNDARRLSEVMGRPIDPALDDYVARGLQREPSKRFQSAQEALAAWRDLRPSLQGVPPNPPGQYEARSGAHKQPSSRPPPRRPQSSPNVAVDVGRDSAFAGRSIPRPSDVPTAVGVPNMPVAPKIEEARPPIVARAPIAPPADLAIVDMTTDDSAATLAMPRAALIAQASSGEQLHNAPKPMDVTPPAVGLGGTQPVLLTRPLPPIPEKPKTDVRLDESSHQNLRPGQLPQHPAGYYIPPAVAKAMVKGAPLDPSMAAPQGAAPSREPLPTSPFPTQQQQPAQPEAHAAAPALTPAQPDASQPIAATGTGRNLPKLHEVGAGPLVPGETSTTDKTQVYKPKEEALQSGQHAKISPAKPDSAKPATAPKKKGVPIVVLLILFLVVGFGAVAGALHFLKR